MARQDNHGRVCAGGDTGQAQGAGESGGDAAGHREEDELKVIVSLCVPAEKRGFLASSLVCWRPRRDLNPCYRRESRPRVRN